MCAWIRAHGSNCGQTGDERSYPVRVRRKCAHSEWLKCLAVTFSGQQQSTDTQKIHHLNEGSKLFCWRVANWSIASIPPITEKISDNYAHYYFIVHAHTDEEPWWRVVSFARIAWTGNGQISGAHRWASNETNEPRIHVDTRRSKSEGNWDVLPLKRHKTILGLARAQNTPPVLYSDRRRMRWRMLLAHWLDVHNSICIVWFVICQ